MTFTNLLLGIVGAVTGYCIGGVFLLWLFRGFYRTAVREVAQERGIPVGEFERGMGNRLQRTASGQAWYTLVTILLPKKSVVRLTAGKEKQT